MGRTEPFEFDIMGEPASKANSRKFVIIRGRPRIIKSSKALGYERDFALQCPKLKPLFEGDVHVDLEIFYATRRPDVDESLILDGMQGRIYRNDRQVRSKTVTGRIDRQSPRTRIRVSLVEKRDRSGDS